MILPLILMLYVVFVWRVQESLNARWRAKERTNVATPSYYSWFERIFPGLPYLWRGSSMLLQNYTRGVPLALDTPEASYIHVSSEQHIRELKDAPEAQLSLHALSKDMFNPRYTMNGLDVHENMIANGIIHTKAIQIGLRSHLPEFYEQLSGIITNCFDENFNTAKAPGQEWVHLSIFSVAKNIITATNAFVFFGPQLASNPVFLKAARDYPEDLFFMAETLRLVPSLLHPCLTPILKRYQRGLKIMVEHITPSVEERLHQERIPSPYRKANREKPRDCIQFFIDSNSREGEWTADKIVQVLLGVWFAGVHQPAMSIAYVLEDLSQNPQYVELLRDELSSTYQDTKDIETKVNTASLIENRPFLDAFLKESSRLRPSDSISVRRKVLEPFTFQDGTHLLAGDVVCLPSQAIMLDDEIYPDSTKFWPWRFLRADSEDISPKRLRCTSRFTTADSTYPRWSLGRHSCPGRFYASFVIKLVIAYIVTSYDIQPPLQNTCQSFQFRSSIIPKANSRLIFRKRAIEE